MWQCYDQGHLRRPRIAAPALPTFSASTEPSVLGISCMLYLSWDTYLFNSQIFEAFAKQIP